MKFKVRTEIFDDFEEKHPTKHPIRICLECGIKLITYTKLKDNNLNVDFFEMCKLFDYLGVKAEDVIELVPENKEDREYLEEIDKIKYLKEHGILIFERKPPEFPTVWWDIYIIYSKLL